MVRKIILLLAIFCFCLTSNKLYAAAGLFFEEEISAEATNNIIDDNGEVNTTFEINGYSEDTDPLSVPKKDLDIYFSVSEINGDSVSVDITLYPADAELIIDGKPFENNQLIPLAAGNHKLQVMKTGYSTLDTIITVSPENKEFYFKLSAIAPVMIEILTVPLHAQIMLDDKPEGYSNTSLHRYPGKYTLKIKKPGYKVIEQEIEISADGKKQFFFRLKR